MARVPTAPRNRSSPFKRAGIVLSTVPYTAIPLAQRLTQSAVWYRPSITRSFVEHRGQVTPVGLRDGASLVLSESGTPSNNLRSDPLQTGHRGPLSIVDLRAQRASGLGAASSTKGDERCGVPGRIRALVTPLVTRNFLLRGSPDSTPLSLRLASRPGPPER